MSTFGTPNPSCATCGDERGGEPGHTTAECVVLPGMTAGELAPLMSPGKRARYWRFKVEQYLAQELAARGLVDDPRPVVNVEVPGVTR